MRPHVVDIRRVAQPEVGEPPAIEREAAGGGDEAAGGAQLIWVLGDQQVIARAARAEQLRQDQRQV
jgi:hypothetical protein